MTQKQDIEALTDRVSTLERQISDLADNTLTLANAVEHTLEKVAELAE